MATIGIRVWRKRGKMKAAHVLIITAILFSVIGTFFAANTINGFTVAKSSLGKADFAAVTGKAVDAGDAGAKQAEGLQAAMSALLFGLVSAAALVVVARIGQNSYAEIRQNSMPRITDALKKAEDAIQAGSHDDAFALYGIIRQQYGQLSNGEKAEHYRRIIGIHRQLSRQAAVMEAKRLTEKYVNGTISEEEFERLKQLIVSQ